MSAYVDTRISRENNKGFLWVSSRLGVPAHQHWEIIINKLSVCFVPKADVSRSPVSGIIYTKPCHRGLFRW